VHFQLGCRRHADKQIFQDGGAIALHPEMHAIAIFDAVVFAIARPHVDVPFVADDAALQADHAGRAHHPGAGGIAMIAALSHRNVEAQRDRVREREFNLAMIAARAEDCRTGVRGLLALRGNGVR
jgi:hypothetical protein